MVVVVCCNRVEKLAYVYTITKVFLLAKNMQLFLMKTTPSLPFGTVLACPQLCCGTPALHWCLQSKFVSCLKPLISKISVMAVRVVEFSNRGYKIRTR